MATRETGWSRWYDDAPTHPKFLAVGYKGGWLYLCGQAYASKHATDGLIPKAIVPRLSDVPSPMKVAAQLVEVGLWHDRGDHFEQHDFTEMQTTAAEREEKREQARERQRRKRDRDRSHARDTGPPVTRDSDVTSRVTHPPVTPAEAEAEGEVQEEERARHHPTWDLLGRRAPAARWAEIVTCRPRIIAALTAAEDAGWPPDRLTKALLAGDLGQHAGAVVVSRAEALAESMPPPSSVPDAPCPDCGGGGLIWPDAAHVREVQVCSHPRARSSA